MNMGASMMAQWVKNLPAMKKTHEMGVQSLGWEDPSPGGGNRNPLQYSCLEIRWTGESGGLQSKGWQRVGHD